MCHQLTGQQWQSETAWQKKKGTRQSQDIIPGCLLPGKKETKRHFVVTIGQIWVWSVDR